MKLTNVALYSNAVEVANLSFRDPSAQNPYSAVNIQGLDADDITPNFLGFSPTTGAQHYSPTLSSREVVLKIGLNAQWADGQSYSELRDDLYRAIAGSRTGTVQLRFRDGLRTVAAVEGFVTKFEAELFTKTPQVQMTVRCNDYMLRAIDRVTVDKTYLKTTNTIVSSQSTAPHGFQFAIKFTQPTTSFSVTDQNAVDQVFTVIPGTIASNTGFIVNDELWFSSEDGGRELYLVRRPVNPDPELDYKVHLIDKIVPGSTWPILFPGANTFEFVSSGAFDWMDMTFLPTYWGV